jgi:glutamyl-tRNA synthetase
LNWCGIPFDEGPGLNEKYGPYRQSERKSLYKAYAEELIANGKAYYAFDSQERLDFHRKDHEEKGKTFIYNWHNRAKLTNSISLPPEEVITRLDRGDAYVIRFKMHEPENEDIASSIVAEDLIRGRVEFRKDILDDKILFKSDGMPTYHLANIVDDHLMEISHVIRGEEWLPSLPLHIALYQAFGWNIPQFAHLPLILKPVGKGKLSKRDGDRLGFPVFPLEYQNDVTGEVSRGYREDGYFPEAFVNMLAFLGWNPGTEQELFTLDELCNTFSLDRVSRGGAKFSPEKAKWYNQQYMMLKSDADLAELFQIKLREMGIDKETDYVQRVVGLIKERAVFVHDLWELGHYFFTAPVSYDQKAVRKQWKEGSPDIMSAVQVVLGEVESFSSANIESVVKTFINAKGLSFGMVMQPLRLCLVGAMKGPHLFEIAEMLGKKETLDRISRALKNIG